MMKENTLLLLLTALVGVGAYLLYKKFSLDTETAKK